MFSISPSSEEKKEKLQDVEILNREQTIFDV